MPEAQQSVERLTNSADTSADVLSRLGGFVAEYEAPDDPEEDQPPGEDEREESPLAATGSEEPSGIGADVDATDNVEPEPEDAVPVELESFRHGGHEFKVTKDELRALAAKGYDYTQHTQRLADERRALDTDRTRFQQDVQAQQALVQDYGLLMVLDAQIQDAEKVAQTPTDDIAERVLRSNSLRDLKDAAAEVAGRIQQARKQHEDDNAARVRGAALAAEAELADPVRGIKGWGPQLYKSMVEYGTKQGFSSQEVQGVVDARVLRLLHKAYLYDTAKMRAKTEAQAPSKKPAAPIKPGARRPEPQTNQRYVDARKALKKSGGRDSRAAQAAIAALLK